MDNKKLKENKIKEFIKLISKSESEYNELNKKLKEMTIPIPIIPKKLTSDIFKEEILGEWYENIEEKDKKQ